MNGMFDKLTPTKDRMRIALERQWAANPGLSDEKVQKLAEESLQHADEERARMGWEDESS